MLWLITVWSEFWSLIRFHHVKDYYMRGVSLKICSWHDTGTPPQASPYPNRGSPVHRCYNWYKVSGWEIYKPLFYILCTCFAWPCFPSVPALSLFEYGMTNSFQDWCFLRYLPIPWSVLPIQSRPFFICETKRERLKKGGRKSLNTDYSFQKLINWLWIAR